MNISYNWLRAFVHLDQDPEALAETLTMLGLEVESVERVGAALDGVVVGHVLDVQQHPNANRLTLCQVDLGDGAPVQIACGAPNVARGQKVPVATVGTTLMLPSRKNPGELEPVTISKAKLRGEISEGMICAEDELGLSDDHGGIMVLDPDAEVGHSFQAYLEARGRQVVDHVLDIAITPNRPDAVSHLGVARDVAALTGRTLCREKVALPAAGGAAAEAVRVQIEAPEACPRYVAMLVRGVTVGPSPEWLQQRLVAVGLRPINNLVDITNYVMYECGQPLHAFDYDQLAGPAIVVRPAKAGEPFVTLDGKERTLPAGTLLICDAERPVAIAGVMGGENSEVSEATTNVLIESAYFDPSTVRQAAKALGLQTDASYRFERGVDTDGQVWAAARAAALMVKLGGGTLVPGHMDAHPHVLTPPTLTLRRSRIAQVLGVDVSAAEVEQYLGGLGFGLETDQGDVFTVTVPTYRPDIEREIDLVEEVARLYGYDHIPLPSHTPIPNRTPLEPASEALRRSTRDLLRGLGYREIYTNSMLAKEVSVRFNQPVLGGSGRDEDVVQTLKPISQEMGTLRPSLLPGLLEVMVHNQNHGQQALRFFEFGHVFLRTERPDTVVPGYAEHEALILGLSGPRTQMRWDGAPTLVDLFDLKGDVATLLDSLRVRRLRETPVHEPAAVAAYHVALTMGSARVGLLAEIPAALAESYGFRQPVYYAELNWSLLSERATDPGAVAYAPINRYPVVERDLAVVVAAAEPVGAMLATIRNAGGALLVDADVFDVYTGSGIPAGQKSVAFALRFGADRTLRDKEVDGRVRAIVKKVTDQHHATLRQ
ncbi:MAG: phenylalanine--tRNA ligase subunit beta [Bacteroidota bacterium]